ncbi:MAG: hypothetical protein WBQ17_05755 [Rhizomicrobium sp.]
MSTSEQPQRRPNVLEKHVDALLERRLKNDREFSASLLRDVLTQAKHSLTHFCLSVVRQAPHEGATGTIDLLVRLFDDHDGELGRILIENKLDSTFTPTQPERYGASAVAMSRINRPAIPVICAPSDYLNRSKYLSPFKASVSYEKIRDMLDGEDRKLMEDAILRFSMPYEPDPVPEVRDFHEGYVQVAAELAPELMVKPNPNPGGERPKDSRTIYFVTRETLPTYAFLPTLRFSHQCWDSSAPFPSAKIMFAEWGKVEALLRRVARPTLEGTPLYLRKAGKSLGLVHNTPRLDNFRPVKSQYDAVACGIRAAATLRAWMFANGAILREWAEIVGSTDQR